MESFPQPCGKTPAEIVADPPSQSGASLQQESGPVTIGRPDRLEGH